MKNEILTAGFIFLLVIIVLYAIFHVSFLSQIFIPSPSTTTTTAA
jgi:hypothetical protein